MMNGNERNFFLIPYREEDGTAHFAKARKSASGSPGIMGMGHNHRAREESRIHRFFPRNAEGESRWAAMDFDGSNQHGNGNDESAREKAFKAFWLLLRHSELFVVLCTSGSGGWHLFAFTRLSSG
jgi:hypothetical protein